MSEYVVPKGMSPLKLRALADWLDIADQAMAMIVVVSAGTEQQLNEALATVRDDEVQRDLRRWADELEHDGIGDAGDRADPDPVAPHPIQ